MSRPQHALAVALALVVPACSFALTDPLRADHPAARTPTCSTHVATVVADVALAAVFVIGTGLVIFQDVHDDTGALEREEEAGMQLAFAAGFAASAWYGARQHRRCEAALVAHDRWIVERTAGSR